MPACDGRGLDSNHHSHWTAIASSTPGGIKGGGLADRLDSFGNLVLGAQAPGAQV